MSRQSWKTPLCLSTHCNCSLCSRFACLSLYNHARMAALWPFGRDLITRMSLSAHLRLPAMISLGSGSANMPNNEIISVHIHDSALFSLFCGLKLDSRISCSPLLHLFSWWYPESFRGHKTCFLWQLRKRLEKWFFLVLTSIDERIKIDEPKTSSQRFHDRMTIVGRGQLVEWCNKPITSSISSQSET